MSADGDAGRWIMLLPAGTFSGRDGRGPYHAGDRASLERIAAQTRKIYGATEMVVDYEHQTINAQKNGQPAPAAGWIKQIEARDDGLYGLVEWTANAASAINAREYRYLSPVYAHAQDGTVLAMMMVSLTNFPNLDIPEVAAHSFFQQASTGDLPMKQVLAALGLAEGASENDALIAINSLLTSSTAIAAAAGLTKDAKSEEILAAVNSAFADRAALAQIVGKPAAAGDELVSAMRAAVATAAPDPARYVPIEQVSAMQADLRLLQVRDVDKEAETAVNEAIRGGQLAPALKDWGISLHKSNPAAFQSFLGQAPVLTAAQRVSAVPSHPSGDGSDLSDSDLSVMRQLGLSRDEFLKSKKGAA
ncbi:phage protease [Rhizobium sp. RU35A]|uniref:phage protease n=1 Tax=Rhizobium sp. RU35A TaxID=1907414 RepID=UPI00165F8336|nr:phage protease [Rhizobium sp. RU35A]